MGPTYYCALCLNSFTEDAADCPNLACRNQRPARGWGRLLGDGDRLDRHYHIDRVLAVGGAGLTYLARELDEHDVPTELRLAIKVLFAQRDSGPFLRRLANEAQILQDLAHPHIVECRGFVNRAGREPYLLTRFEGGGSLHDHIEAVGPLPVDVAAAVLRQVLGALEVTHQRGVIHRDLKPQNVLLRERVSREQVPHTLVADFGIAKVSGTMGQGLTQVGAFVGTPEFAAPEQFEGMPPTPATDVFAAGALFHYLLAGLPPVAFTHRQDILTSLRELLSGVPPAVPPTVTDPEVVAALQRLFTGLMAVLPSDRWEIPETLTRLIELEALVASRPPAALDPVLAGQRTARRTGTMFPGMLEEEERTAPVASAHSPRRMRLRDEDTSPTTHAVPRARPSAPSLDGVFASAAEEAVAVVPMATNQMSLDDLFSQHTAAPPVPEPEPPAPPPEPAPPPAKPRRWMPATPERLPEPLPEEAGALLRLLGGVAEADREALFALLDGHESLASSVRGYRRDDGPETGRGVALMVARSADRGQANAMARLLEHEDPGVRACAAEALAVVGTAALLTRLSRLATDPDPDVRGSAALAIARGCARADRHGLGRSWIQPLRDDGDPGVRASWKAAMDLLAS